MIDEEFPIFICSHIYENTHAVLLVAREDGDWMFLCGQTHPDDDDPIVVGLDHLLQRDPSLQDILDLEDNSEAERDALGAEWTRKESPA